MKPYEQLTQRGRLRRLRHMAEIALTAYDLDVRACDLVSASTNVIYRVRTTDGMSYALRLARLGWRTMIDLQSEAMWLDALADDSGIRAPQVVRTKQGASVIPVRAIGVSQARNATLMTWLPGTVLGKRLTEENLTRMGELFARMHIHGKAWRPPAGFTTQRFDNFISRDEPNVLLGAAQLRAYPAHFPRGADVMREICERVTSAYAILDRTDLRVIHCDLWHDNIKVYRGELCPFDFEDTIWGYRLHDISMAMLDLLEEVGEERYKFLFAAFRAGYERHLDWPEGDMTLMQIGRMLWKMNYVARFEPEWFTKGISFYIALFERYLEHGRLVPPLKLGQ